MALFGSKHEIIISFDRIKDTNKVELKNVNGEERLMAIFLLEKTPEQETGMPIDDLKMAYAEYNKLKI